MGHQRRTGGAGEVYVDSVGNLYITDYNGCRIRKVSAGTGIMTTVAGTGTVGYSGDGGAATSAAIHSPGGVALDSAGNLYITDQKNNRFARYRHPRASSRPWQVTEHKAFRAMAARRRVPSSIIPARLPSTVRTTSISQISLTIASGR